MESDLKLPQSSRHLTICSSSMLIHSYQYHYFPRTCPNQSTLTKFNKTAPTHAASPMTIITYPTTSTLRFLYSINSRRFQDPRRLLLVDGSVHLKLMATKLEETPIQGTGDEDKKGCKGEELAKELPPPPEKPEPGDCCGSGCVRCVWDVYYDELEDYNKLYKPDSKDSTSNSS